MTKTLLFLVTLTNFAFGAAIVDSPAPDFKVKDTKGKVQSLKDYSGKWVVLEWFNKDCPYVKKHYGSNNMQTLQKTYGGKNVAWLTVLSSAAGKQGHMTAKDADAYFTETGSAPKAVLLDEEGTVGKAYDAKTTPHMYVIDPKGKLVYAGAIDDNDSSSSEVIPKSKNYVAAALDAGLAGKAIEVKSSKPYGCSVKYK